MLLSHEILATASQGGAVLCSRVLDGLRRELPQGSFTAAEAVAALEAGVEWTDAARGYQALVLAGFLPDTGVVWRMAGLAFRGLPAPLSAFAETLGPENWKEARAATTGAAARTAYYAAAWPADRAEIIAIICAAIDAAPAGPPQYGALAVARSG